MNSLYKLSGDIFGSFSFLVITKCFMGTISIPFQENHKIPSEYDCQLYNDCCC